MTTAAATFFAIKNPGNNLSILRELKMNDDINSRKLDPTKIIN